MEEIFYLSDYRLHIHTHTQTKTFACKTCAKLFRSPGNLRRHHLVHTGERPAKCPIDGCDRAYMYQIDLKRHKYSAHGIWTKRHPCQACGKEFPEPKILRKHLSTHHP